MARDQEAPGRAISRPTTDLASAGKVIVQLARIDPDGQECRYAPKQDGSRTLLGIDQINLIAFHEAMIGVASFLDAAETSTGGNLSAKREMDSYYAPEFGSGWSDFVRA